MPAQTILDVIGDFAPITHATVKAAQELRADARGSQVTNARPHASPVLPKAARERVNRVLVSAGAPAMVGLVDETKARKNLRMAFRANGIDAKAAKARATLVVRESWTA